MGLYWPWSNIARDEINIGTKGWNSSSSSPNYYYYTPLYQVPPLSSAPLRYHKDSTTHHQLHTITILHFTRNHPSFPFRTKIPSHFEDYIPHRKLPMDSSSPSSLQNHPPWALGSPPWRWHHHTSKTTLHIAHEQSNSPPPSSLRHHHFDTTTPRILHLTSHLSSPSSLQNHHLYTLMQRTGRKRSEPDDNSSAVHVIIAPSMQGRIDPVRPFISQLESCEGSHRCEGRPETVRLSLCVAWEVRGSTN